MRTNQLRLWLTSMACALRHIKFAIASACPYQYEFALAHPWFANAAR
jgi:hypothetical protein